MSDYEAKSVVASLINPHKWTFTYKEDGFLRNHEKNFKVNFISREMAYTAMIAFVDEKNLGIDVS